MLQLRPSAAAAKQIKSLSLSLSLSIYIYIYTHTHTHIYLNNPPANAEEACSVPGSKRPSREGNGYPHPVLLPGESHGQRNLAGYNPWSRKESDTTEDAHNMMCISIYARSVPSELHLVFV